MFEPCGKVHGKAAKSTALPTDDFELEDGRPIGNLSCCKSAGPEN